MTRRFLLASVVLLLASATMPRAQGDAAAPVLRVTGDVGTALSLTASDLKAMPRTRVEIKEEARTVTYEGVLVSEILKLAGAPTGADLRGNALASYIVAVATGRISGRVFDWELDPALSGHDIVVADSVDGKVLFAYQGPFRIVAPRDTRAARSVRMLERLDVVRLRK